MNSTYKEELNKMAIDLKSLFSNQQSMLHEYTIIDAYKQGEINNIQASIYLFELQAMKAVYETSTVPNFREYYEEIKENISNLYKEKAKRRS